MIPTLEFFRHLVLGMIIGIAIVIWVNYKLDKAQYGYPKTFWKYLRGKK